MMQNDTTICAISTPAGVGGIAVIRISGKDAISSADMVFVGRNKLSELTANTAVFGRIMDGDHLVDEVVLTLFRAPHSFTGEDVVEIGCHGSVFVQQELLRLLMASGCQLAQPGEFTQRAFLRGKMDLSQAEAVADVIASQSSAEHRLAMNQMRGGFSKELQRLRMQLLEFTSLMELELDFSEEEVEFADREQLLRLAEEIDNKITTLADSFREGNAIKNGVPVALVGETNAGKSTLLNHLLQEEKAIVSDVHGTTRDLIEDRMSIKGVGFRFIDTAGLRETDDTIEKIGIERSFSAIEKASIVLWLVDASQMNDQIDWVAQEVVQRCDDKKLILVFNKIDKLSDADRKNLTQLFPKLDAKRIYISAKKNLHTDELAEALVQSAELPHIASDDVVVSNLRHYEALLQAKEAIRRVLFGLEEGISGDFVSQDLRECLHFLGDILGEVSSQDVLTNIFGRFCIGK